MSIEVSQGLVPATANTPLDARTRVATLDDVATIPLAFVGMEFYCIATGKKYVVKSLKAKVVGALTIPDMLIDQYEEVATTAAWDGITGKPEAFANLAENHSAEVGFDNVPTMTAGEDESGNPTLDKPFQAFVVGCNNSYGSHAILYGDGNENTLGFVTVIGSNNKTYQFQHIIGDLNDFAEAVNVTVFGSNNKGNAKARGAFAIGNQNQINAENVTAIGHALTIGARDATVIGKHGELADAPENEGAFAVAGGALNAPKLGLIHRVNKAVLNPLYNAAKDTGNTGTDSDGERKYLPEQAFATEYRGHLLPETELVTAAAGSVTLDHDQFGRWIVTPSAAVTPTLANWRDGDTGELIVVNGGALIQFPASWVWLTSTPESLEAVEIFVLRNVQGTTYIRHERGGGTAGGGGTGPTVYVSSTEPTDAPEGALWVVV